jgi:hypothetical protein
MYHGQNRLAEAGQMYQRALLGLQNSLGSEHPSTMAVMNNMKMLDLEMAKRLLSNGSLSGERAEDEGSTSEKNERA